MTTTTSGSIEEKLAYPADHLPISIRGHGIIRNLGFQTVNDLVNTDAKSLLAVRNCGKKTVAEIVACLKIMGLKMKNSDGMFPDAVLDEHIASIRKYLAQLREPKPKVEVETFHEKRAEEIKQKQIQVMQMRANGVSFRSIAKEIGRHGHTARIYFSRFGRSLVWEAKKRGITVAEILTEKNIPLAAIDLMRKDGIEVRG